MIANKLPFLDYIQEITERERRYDPINKPRMAVNYEVANDVAPVKLSGFGTQFAH